MGFHTFFGMFFFPTSDIAITAMLANFTLDIYTGNSCRNPTDKICSHTMETNQLRKQPN